MKFPSYEIHEAMNYYYVAGMQGHGAKYPCAWCFGTAPFKEKAKLRTLGDLRKLAEEFQSADGGKGDKKVAMDYFNVIKSPLLDGPDDALILDVLILDELHLMLGELRFLVFLRDYSNSM